MLPLIYDYLWNRKPVNEQLYATSGNELLLFSGNYGNLQNHVTFAGSVVNFHFNYNK